MVTRELHSAEANESQRRSNIGGINPRGGPMCITRVNWSTFTPTSFVLVTLIYVNLLIDTCFLAFTRRINTVYLPRKTRNNPIRLRVVRVTFASCYACVRACVCVYARVRVLVRTRAVNTPTARKNGRVGYRSYTLTLGMSLGKTSRDTWRRDCRPTEHRNEPSAAEY